MSAVENVMTNETLLDALAAALQDAARVNGATQVIPAAVLWPDTEQQWSPVFSRLREKCPGLLQLGTYAPDEARGPAIWLKCVIGGTIANQKNSDGKYIIHLPGYGRSDLRAIESCPREIQPLAELQYRGAFWSQVSGKDWTINAFLTSKNGGLALDVAQDKATQEALTQAIEAGVLLDRPLAELRVRQINASWLNSLLAPNPIRDLLVWMNDPGTAYAKWNKQQRTIFEKRASADFGFDPDADGVLVAAEKLAKGEGAWGSVSELYQDSFGSFPNILELLAQVQPPQRNLFDGFTGQGGYPQVNEVGESTLRQALVACGNMMPDQARDEIVKLESEHNIRRTWLWARMGLAPLATALEFLAQVAMESKQLPVGETPNALAASYQGGGWRVDAAAMRALGSVVAKVDVDAVSSALRGVYLPWLEASAKRLQEAAQAVGGLSSSENVFCAKPAAGNCTVFVDGLRYDAAIRLQTLLNEVGNTVLEAAWTSMPSVTASGKAWCSPVAPFIGGDPSDAEFQPRVALGGKPLSAHNFRKLLAEHGFEFLDRHETGDITGAAWTETGDLDHYGHEHGIRLARDMESQLVQVAERIKELQQVGWKTFRIVTDHGWLLVPGGLPKTELPKHQTETRWGRCAVLKDSAYGTPLTFGWDWCNDVQVAYAPGVSCFVAGNEYAHGGISLQECWVPILTLESTRTTVASVKATISSICWRGLRCVVEVSAESDNFSVDIRTKPAMAPTSLVIQPKPLVSGKVSLAIGDDDQLGAAAVVVILDAEGHVIQKMATTVGG